MDSASTTNTTNVPVPTQHVSQPRPEPKPVNNKAVYQIIGATGGGLATGLGAANAVHSIKAQQRGAAESLNTKLDEANQQIHAGMPDRIVIDGLERCNLPSADITKRFEVAGKIDDSTNYTIVNGQIVPKTTETLNELKNPEYQNSANNDFASLSLQQSRQTQGVLPSNTNLPQTSPNVSGFSFIAFCTILGAFTGYGVVTFFWNSWTKYNSRDKNDSRDYYHYSRTVENEIPHLSRKDVSKRTKNAKLDVNDYVKIAFFIKNESLYKTGKLSRPEFFKFLKDFLKLSDQEIESFINRL